MLTQFRPVIFLLLSISICGLRSSTEGSNSYAELIPGTDHSIDMVWIKGGEFNFGSTKQEKERDEDEGPIVKTNVADFWMSTYEITWDQYQYFLYREIDGRGEKKYDDVDLNVDGVSGATMPYVNLNKSGYPVVNITQYAASMFCKWLSAKTGHFYRLPTEKEWEFACRGGTVSPYSFGKKDALDDYAWHAFNSNRTIQKPGLKKPNPYGLYDMHGNAAEWVLDGYSANGYQKLNEGTEYIKTNQLYPRVVRGGSWKDDPKELRSAARNYSTPKWKQKDPQFPKSLWWHTDALHVGFRIVRPGNVPSRDEMENYWVKPITEY